MTHSAKEKTAKKRKYTKRNKKFWFISSDKRKHHATQNHTLQKMAVEIVEKFGTVGAPRFIDNLSKLVYNKTIK